MEKEEEEKEEKEEEEAKEERRRRRSYSSLHRLKCTTAWMFRFISNC